MRGAALGLAAFAVVGALAVDIDGGPAEARFWLLVVAAAVGLPTIAVFLLSSDPFGDHVADHDREETTEVSQTPPLVLDRGPVRLALPVGTQDKIAA